VVQTTDHLELESHLRQQSRTLYCGFRPDGRQLHIGSLGAASGRCDGSSWPGHRAIATDRWGYRAGGLIPVSRRPNGVSILPQSVGEWTESIKTRSADSLNLWASGALVVNNLEWLESFRLLDFLREVGKHFSINSMIQKDSVRQRIEREGEGISFCRVHLHDLQAYDFAELNRRYQCTLQIGGSDQWGNITGGIDLCRRQNQSRVHALTFPLVTKADGTKFGKTESGTICWIPERPLHTPSTSSG